MNPRSRDEQKNPFCVSSKNNCFKDNVKTAHWVGQSQLGPLDTYYFCERTPVVDDIQASVTGNKMKKSVSEGKKIPDLLKEEENVAGEADDDAVVNTEENKVNDKKMTWFLQ